MDTTDSLYFLRGSPQSFCFLKEIKSQKYSDSSAPSGKLYRVQVGAFKEKSNAENCLQKAKDAGFSDAFIVEV